MNAFENLKTFLYDQNNFIAIYNDNVHVFSYLKIISFTNNLISLQFSDFKLDIVGKNLKIISMQSEELVIKGKINNLNFNYEKHR